MRLKFSVGFRVSEDEMKGLERLMAIMQQSARPGATVTQREAILTALNFYARYLMSLQRDKGRKR